MIAVPCMTCWQVRNTRRRRAAGRSRRGAKIASLARSARLPVAVGDRHAAQLALLDRSAGRGAGRGRPGSSGRLERPRHSRAARRRSWTSESGERARAASVRTASTRRRVEHRRRLARGRRAGSTGTRVAPMRSTARSASTAAKEFSYQSPTRRPVRPLRRRRDPRDAPSTSGRRARRRVRDPPPPPRWPAGSSRAGRQLLAQRRALDLRPAQHRRELDDERRPGPGRRHGAARRRPGSPPTSSSDAAPVLEQDRRPTTCVVDADHAAVRDRTNGGAARPRLGAGRRRPSRSGSSSPARSA